MNGYQAPPPGSVASGPPTGGFSAVRPPSRHRDMLRHPGDRLTFGQRAGVVATVAAAGMLLPTSAIAATSSPTEAPTVSIAAPAAGSGPVIAAADLERGTAYGSSLIEGIPAGTTTTATAAQPLRAQFDSGLRRLDTAALGALTGAAQKLVAGHPGAALEVVGYTDGTGSSAANIRLAQARAEAVRDALAAALPGVQIGAVGGGELAGGADGRRVEVRALG